MMKIDFKSIWSEDCSLISAYYNKKLIKHENGLGSVDWKDKEKYLRVCEFVMGFADSREISSIYDVGCGLGHFYDYYTENHGKEIRYAGIDIVPHFIEKTKEKTSSSEISLKNLIDLDPESEEKYDLVINLGGLNSRTRYYRRYLEHSIRKMISISRKYLVFNIITSINDSYFPKKSNKLIGHITDFSKDGLIGILEKMKTEYGISYKIKDVTIFENSYDSFVCIYR